jgi:hypothetical protein
MTWTHFLAHGALGYWDELFLPLVAAVFIGLLVMTWVRRPADSIEDSPPDPTPNSPKPSAQAPAQKRASRDEHFTLD